MPPPNQPSMDFGKAFAFMFNDKQWISKIAIGGAVMLLSCFLIGIPFLFGYLKKLFLSAVKDEDCGLPDWDFGEDFKEGLLPVGVMFCYFIPIIILGAIPCIGCFAAPLSMAVCVVLPAILALVYIRNDFAAAFDFRAISKFIGDNVSNYIIFLIIAILADIASMFGFFAFIIGIFFTAFWYNLVAVHALAQVWRRAEGLCPAEGPVGSSEGAPVEAQATVVEDPPPAPAAPEDPSE